MVYNYNRGIYCAIKSNYVMHWIDVLSLLSLFYCILKKKVSTKENKLEPFFILIYEALNLTLATTQHEQPDLR